MRVRCADLNPHCDAELQGGSIGDVVLQYVLHVRSCMHQLGPVELDALLHVVTLAPGSAAGQQRACVDGLGPADVLV